MGVIRVVWGAATGPTELSAYDAALAEANVHDYNLVSVSSVVPADTTIGVVGEAPDLGPAGERLTVVQGRATVAPGSADGGDGTDSDGHAEQADRAVASLGWSREPDGPGIFYESSGTDPAAVEARVEEGLAAGRRLRDWEFADGGCRTVTAEADPHKYATAVVLAVYGESTPLL